MSVGLIHLSDHLLPLIRALDRVRVNISGRDGESESIGWNHRMLEEQLLSVILTQDPTCI